MSKMVEKEECCVCFEEFAVCTCPNVTVRGIKKPRRLAAKSGKQGKAAVSFPCGHRTCEECFARCENCPLCRTGKDGRAHSERRADERRAASAPVFVRIVTFQGSRETPMSSLSVSVFSGVASPSRSMLPEAIFDHMRSGDIGGGRSLLGCD